MGKRKFGALEKLEADPYEIALQCRSQSWIANSFAESVCSTRSSRIPGKAILCTDGNCSLILYSAYFHDFQEQYEQYISNRAFLLSAPASRDHGSFVSFRTQIDFLAHVADSYSEDIQDFPGQLIELLERHHETLEAETREKIVGCLVLLRRKSILGSDKYGTPVYPLNRQRPYADG